MNLLEIAQSIGIEGFLHCDELQKLVELAAGRHVLEVGSYRGLSAWGMGIAAESVTCVDTFKAASDGQRQTEDFTTLTAWSHATRRYKNVAFHASTSEEAARVFRNQTFGMIFLDAMHTYDEVKGDIARWYPLLEGGGIFAFHDYRHGDFPDVERAVDEVFGPAPDGTTVVTLRWLTKP